MMKHRVTAHHGLVIFDRANAWKCNGEKIFSISNRRGVILNFSSLALVSKVKQQPHSCGGVRHRRICLCKFWQQQGQYTTITVLQFSGADLPLLLQSLGLAPQ